MSVTEKDMPMAHTRATDEKPVWKKKKQNNNKKKTHSPAPGQPGAQKCRGLDFLVDTAG